MHNNVTAIQLSHSTAPDMPVVKKGIDQDALIEYYMQPIAHLFRLDGVTEILVDRYDDIKIEQHGELVKTDAAFSSEGDLVSFVTQIGVMLNQPVHPRDYPSLNGRLPSGARVNATLHPISVRGTSMAIRCFPKCTITPEQLVEFGSLTETMLHYLRLCVKTYHNIFIAGSTGSGKTTLMNALNAFILPNDRLVTAEDTQELQVDAFSNVMLEAPNRKQSDTQAQKITLPNLIADTLRKYPKRIYVGEIRLPDAANAFLTALNTGHRGCMSTIHANSCEDALYRLDGLVAASDAKLPFTFVQQQVRSNIDLVIFQEKTPMFGRRVTEIAEVRRDGVCPIFQFDYKTGGYSSHLDTSVLQDHCLKFGYSYDKEMQAVSVA